MFFMHQRLKRCSVRKAVDCQIKMACSYGDAYFGCLVALVGFKYDWCLGWLHHMCQGEYDGAKGIVHESGKKKLCRVCVDNIFCASVG